MCDSLADMSDLASKDRATRDLEVALDDLGRKYHRKCEECSHLEDIIKKQTDDFLSLQSKLRENQIGLAQLEEEILPLKFENHKISKEKSYAEERLQLLEHDYRNKSNKLHELEQLHIVKVSDLENKLATYGMENKQFQEKINDLQMIVHGKNEKIDSYSSKLTSLEQEHISNNNRDKEQIEFLKKNIDKYKSFIDESNNKNNEMVTTIATLKENVSTTTAALNSSKSEVGHLNSKVGTLEDKINELNVVIQRFEAEKVEASKAAVAVIVDDTYTKELEGLSTTDLYNRVIASENNAITEKNKRLKIEISLTAILKDVEAKTIVQNAQQRDYKRIVESYTMMSQKLDVVLQENNNLKYELGDVGMRLENAMNNLIVTQQANEDMCIQLQHLLRQSSSGLPGFNKGNSMVEPHIIEPAYDEFIESIQDDRHITMSTITYSDIHELQRKNVYLLKIIRKLAKEKDLPRHDEQLQLISSENSQALMTAQNELNALREERRITEDMVKAIVQQRDVYRAMLSEKDQANAMKLLMSHTKKGTPSKESSEDPHQHVADTSFMQVSYRIELFESEIKRLNEKIKRLEEAENVTNNLLEKSKGECTALRLELAHINGEMRFNKEKVERLEQDLLYEKNENKNLAKRKKDLEDTISVAQKELKQKNDTIKQEQDRVRQCEERLHKSEIDVKVCKQSEERTVVLLQEEREKSKKQLSLDGSIRRIETGLISRLEEEKSSLLSEKEAMLNTVESLRKQMHDKSVIDDEKIKLLEGQLYDAQNNVVTVTHELNHLKEVIIKEEAISKSATERAVILEKQLASEQERLNSMQTVKIIEKITVQENVDKDLALERANTQIDSLKKQLATSEGYYNKYKMLSTETEKALHELKERIALVSKSNDEEIHRLKSELETVSTELQNHRNNNLSSVQEVEDAREQLRESIKLYTAQVAAVTEEKNVLMNKLSATDPIINELKSEIYKLQVREKASHNNYERELSLHASAEKEVREQRDELDKQNDVINQLKKEINQLQTAASVNKQLLNDEVANKNNQVVTLQESISELKGKNDTLTQYINQLESKVNNLSCNVADVSQENVIIDLTSTIRSLKKELDLRKDEVVLANNEKDHFQSIYTKLLRTSDELQLELSTYKASGKCDTSSEVVIKKEEYDHYVSEANRINLLEESNSSLRQERDREKSKVESMRDEVKKVKEKLLPIESSHRKMEAEYDAVKKENASLQESVAHWRDSFLKGSHVDPDEHRKALSRIENLENVNNNYLELIDSHQTKIDELSRAVTEMTQAAVITNATLHEQQSSQLLLQEEKVKLEADLAQEQARLATERSNSEKLRKTCREFKEKLQATKAESDAVKDELTTAKSELEATKTEIESLKTQASTVVRPKVPRVKPVIEQVVAAETVESSDVVTTSSTTFGTAHRTEVTPEIVGSNSASDSVSNDTVVMKPMNIADERTRVETVPAAVAVNTPAVKRMKRKGVTESVPVAAESVPVAAETAPVAVETAPVAAETAPVVTKTVPIATETAPVVTKTVPIATETAPVETSTLLTETAIPTIDINATTISKDDVEVMDEMIVPAEDVGQPSTEEILVATTTEVKNTAVQEAAPVDDKSANNLQMMRMQLLKRKKASAASVNTASISESDVSNTVAAHVEAPSPVTKKVKVNEESVEDKAMSEAIDILFDADSNVMETDDADTATAVDQVSGEVVEDVATRDDTSVNNDVEAVKKVTSFGKSLTLEERQKKFGRSASNTSGKPEIESGEMQEPQVVAEVVPQVVKPKTRKIKPPPKVKTTPDEEAKPGNE